jgi:hypothetical protein
MIIEACLPDLQAAAAERGGDALVERDFQRAIEAASGARSARITLDRWPAVGSVDVMLADRRALELKWCRSGDTLANCAWDIAKLGCSIAERRVAEGFIAAGAPRPHWASGADGVELFGDATYTDDELIRRYESWWRFWCKDVLTRPVELPRSLAVVDEGSTSAELNGAPFEFRVARVEVVDSTWRTHVCPHRWQGELCRPRPWDPQGLGGLRLEP